MINREINTDLSKILIPYENMWVALSEDNTEVIEASNILDELINKLKKEDRRYKFLKVPCFSTVFISVTL